jgi:hypothetical protein
VVVNSATLITVMVRGMFAAATERRHRRYDLEDRTALAAKVEATAGILAAKVEASSKAVSSQLGEHDTWERKQIASNHAALVSDIAENTKISTDAFHEANTVNQKLEKLGLEHNAIDRVASEARDRRDDKR